MALLKLYMTDDRGRCTFSNLQLIGMVLRLADIVDPVIDPVTMPSSRSPRQLSCCSILD